MLLAALWRALRALKRALVAKTVYRCPSCRGFLDDTDLSAWGHVSGKEACGQVFPSDWFPPDSIEELPD